MIIADKLKVTNRAEYLLYMWQVEDLIRAYDCDAERIAKEYVTRFQLDEDKRQATEKWYADLCEMMRSEGKMKSGHLQICCNILQELTELNQQVNGQWMPVVSPSDPDEWYWPGDGFVSGNTLYIFQQRFMLDPSQPAGFNFTQTGVDVALFSLPGLQLQSVQPFNDDPDVDWGTAVMEDGGFLYIYGTESIPFNKFAHVSRTALDAPFQQMQYWDGTAWTSDPQATARVRSGLSQAFSVFKHADRYYLLSQENVLGPDIFIWDAPSPKGPFTNKRKLYTTPQPPGTWTYNAVAHPHTITPQGDLLLCYSINVQDFFRLFDNADLYRPIFLRARGWE